MNKEAQPIRDKKVLVMISGITDEEMNRLFGGEVSVVDEEVIGPENKGGKKEKRKPRKPGNRTDRQSEVKRGGRDTPRVRPDRSKKKGRKNPPVFSGGDIR